MNFLHGTVGEEFDFVSNAELIDFDGDESGVTDLELHDDHPVRQKSYLPWIVVIPVQLASSAWKLLAAFIMETPFLAFFASIATVDILFDWVVAFTVGLVCRPCASMIIWAVNIVYLPFWIAAWAHHILLDTFGLFIDGWMLFFNFSGCYLFIGRHCWMQKGGSVWLYYKIPLLQRLFSEPKGFVGTFKELVTPPDLSGEGALLSHSLEKTKSFANINPGFSMYRV